MRKIFFVKIGIILISTFVIYAEPEVNNSKSMNPSSGTAADSQNVESQKPLSELSLGNFKLFGTLTDFLSIDKKSSASLSMEGPEQTFVYKGKWKPLSGTQIKIDWISFKPNKLKNFLKTQIYTFNSDFTCLVSKAVTTSEADQICIDAYSQGSSRFAWMRQ